MRGKKGDIQNLIVVLFIMIAIGAILVKGTADKSTVVKIGERQTLVMKSYLEAEKVREYYNGAARLAATEAAKELGAKGDDCFSVPGFDEKFNSKIALYFNYDLSANPQLEVKLPYIAWSTIAGPGKVTITGVASDKIIVSGEGFEYAAGLYVNQEISCEDVASLVT